MKLDPRIRMMLAFNRLTSGKPLEQLPVKRARRVAARQLGMLLPFGDYLPLRGIQVQEHTIEGPGGPLPLRLYRPAGDKLPVLLYAHGGGFVLFRAKDYDRFCKRLAAQSGCMVVSVDYRLAPEARWPAGVEDMIAAYNWLRRQAGEWGGDASRIAFAGDSAGGHIVFGAAIRLRDAGSPLPRALAAFCPIGDTRQDAASHAAFGGGQYLLSTAFVAWGLKHYLPEAALHEHPETALTRFADLKGLPPALLVSAGFDPLRDEAHALADALRTQGNAVQLLHFDEVTHMFYLLYSMLPQTQKMMRGLAGFLKEEMGA